MSTLKKLIPAPFFLLTFLVLIYQLTPIIKSSDLIFSFSSETLIQLVIVSALISFSSFLFVILTTLAGDVKLVLPISILTALSSFLFLPISLAIVFTVISAAFFMLTIFNLEAVLKSYLNFNAGSLLGPAIKNLSGLLILATALVYFLSVSKMISEQGFQIPDSLIDTALELTQSAGTTGGSSQPQISIPPEQLKLLRQNPDLLRQSGLDPAILDSLNGPSPNLSNDLIKVAVKDQLQSILKPYLSFVPAVLALILFLTLQSLTALINLLIYPLLWSFFYILEKSGFIHFEVEMRQVKKLVV